MILFAVILFFYVALITQLAFGIAKMNKQNKSESSSPKTTFSPILPMVLDYYYIVHLAMNIL